MKLTKFILISVFLIALVSRQVTTTDGANILGLFTSHSPSHLIVHMAMAKALVEKGHNVTIVVSHEPRVDHNDINVIIIPPTIEQEKMLQQDIINMAHRKDNIVTKAKNFFGTMKHFIDMQADVLKDPRFTVLYDNPDTKFDLVMFGFFMNSFQLGVAAKFNAPVIVIWLSATMLLTNRFIGNPIASSYVPTMNMAIKGGEKMSFLQRLQNLFMNTYFDGIMKVLDIRMRRFYNELFPTDGSFPTLDDMYKNISLVFCNSHFSEGSVRPNVPGLVEIGGIQVKDRADPLPEDLAKIMDSANDTGALLFSLGSNFKGSSMNPDTASYIYNVLSKLKHKVIWKWEDLENTPGNSPNIIYKKWLPQDDILAHPNLKLFITHAGRGGIAEAQYHGVPMLAIPIFGDQHNNAMKMVQSGYGQLVELLSFSEETFKMTLHEVLNNPLYTENVQQFSRLYLDRPLSARESFVFWTEYVLRHHGAVHMQSPLVHMNFIESSNLDVFAFLLLMIYIGYSIIKLAFKFVSRKLSKKSQHSAVKTKKAVDKVKKQ